MSSAFDHALEDMKSLLECSLCHKDLKFTQSLRECGHHFCYDCIYPVLGPTGICPTCGTKAIVGNMLDLTSYDVLLACRDKLANLRMHQVHESSQTLPAPTLSPPSHPQQAPQKAPEREETPMGTVIWTYDCGPTLPSPLRLDQLSEASSSSLPSLNTAMVSHNRELTSRTQKQREQEKATFTSSSSITDPIGGGASEPRETRKQPSEEAMPPPFRPTIRQLQQLLNMKDSEPDAVPNSQEHEAQTQTLSIHHNHSQHSDTESLNTLSAPIHAYQSSIEAFQPSDDDSSLFESYTQAMVKNKRRTSVDHTHSDITSAPDQKRRQNSAQARPLGSTPALQLQPQPQRPPPYPHDFKGKGKAVETDYPRADKFRSRSMTPAGKAQESHHKVADKFRARSMTPNMRSNAVNGSRNPRGSRHILLPQSRDGSETIPTSEDESETVEMMIGRRRRSDGEVETSQPTMDEVMPSLFIRDTGRRSESRSRSREPHSRLVDPDYMPASKRELQLVKKPDDLEIPPIVSCIFTGLSAKASAAFDANTTRLVEAGLLMEHIPNEDSSDSCTHIVTSVEKTYPRHQQKDKEGHVFELCPRKLKYLFGLLSPAWIVRHEWFTDSIEHGQWLPLTVESEYLVQGNTHFGPTPGTTARRQARHKAGQRLFESCRMFFYGDFRQSQTFKRLELQRLVQRGGATVLSRRPTRSGTSSQTKGELFDNAMFGPERRFLYLPDNSKPWQVSIDRHRPIVVCDPSHLPTVIEVSQLSPADMRKHGWLRDFQAVSVTWLLNCISCSIMGDEDLEKLNSVSDDENSDQVMEKTRNQIWELDQAWHQWYGPDTEK